MNRDAVRLGAALALGLAVGAGTSLLQTYADQPWLGLVNSASPWLTTAFVAGLLQTRLPLGVLAGVAATVLEVVGYYGCASLRGFGVSSSYLLLWTACAVLGGTLFGAAGAVWRARVPARWLVAAAALLPASFLAEGLVSYGWRLGYTSTAVLFVGTGALLAVGLAARHGRWSAAAGWLALLGLLGAGGYVALGALF